METSITEIAVKRSCFIAVEYFCKVTEHKAGFQYLKNGILE
jgi:hypothetical protein